MPRPKPEFVTVALACKFVAATDRAVKVKPTDGGPGAMDPFWVPKTCLRLVTYVDRVEKGLPPTKALLKNKPVVKFQIAKHFARELGLL